MEIQKTYCWQWASVRTFGGVANTKFILVLLFWFSIWLYSCSRLVTSLLLPILVHSRRSFLFTAILIWSSVCLRIWKTRNIVKGEHTRILDLSSSAVYSANAVYHEALRLFSGYLSLKISFYNLPCFQVDIKSALTLNHFK